MATDSYNYIRQLAKRRGVDPDLAEAVLHQESRGKANAVSPVGAVGLMQTMPSTLKDPGFGVAPAKDNSTEELARVGVDYLGMLLKRYKGNVGAALAAYNAGPGRADKYGEAVPFAETQKYVKNIKADFLKKKKMGAKDTSAPPMQEDMFAGLADFEDTPKAKPLPSKGQSLAGMAVDAVFPPAMADEAAQFEGLADFEDANGPNAQQFDDPLNTDGGVEGQFDNVDINDDPFAGLADFDEVPNGIASEDLPVQDTMAEDAFAVPDTEFTPSVMSKLPTDIEGAAKALGFDASKFPKDAVAKTKLPGADTYSGPLGGIYYGFEKSADNLQNLAIKGVDALVGGDPQDNYFRAFLQKYKDAMRQEARVAQGAAPGSFDAMELVGAMLAPVPGGAAKTTLGKVGQAALSGGAAGMAYGNADIGSDDFWSQKLMSAGVGAAAGGSLSGLAQGATYGANKLVNAAKGTLTPEAAALQQAYKDAGVPMLATDAMPDGKVTNTMAAVMNNLPVIGTSGVRHKQTEAAGNYVQKLADDAAAQAKSMDYELPKGFKKLAKNPKSREGVSSALMAEAGDDLGRITAASADLMTVREAQQADKLFDKVRQLADDAGVKTNYDNMLKTVDESVKNLESSKFRDDSLINMLKITSSKIKRNPDMGMDDLLKSRTAVSTLLEKANDAALFTHAPQAVRVLSDVKKALDADLLAAVGGSKSKVAKALNQADEFERVTVRGREGAKLTKALETAKETGDYDEVANLVMRPHLVDRAAKSASLLDPKGKQALLASIMQKGVEQAKSNGTGEFSTKTMATFLGKNSKALRTLGGPEFTQQVEGYNKLLQHMNKKTHSDKMSLGSTAIATGTGAGIGLYSMNAFTNPAFWTGAAGMGILFRTEAGKRILLASNKSPIGSDRMNALVNQLGQQANKAAAMASTQQGIQ